MSTPRKTIVTIEERQIDLFSYYLAIHAKTKVDYKIFRSRAKSLQKRNALKFESLSDAISMTNTDWVTFYGGGKYKEYIYDGYHHINYIGKKFRSLSAFLKIINKYKRTETSPGYALIKSRILRNWNIDNALETPPIDNKIGRIYVIKSSITDLLYVGQTIDPLETRFRYHIYDYNNKKNTTERPLYNAFKKYGEESFFIELIEDNIPKQILAERENYWIKQLNTMFPSGLNKIDGQTTASGYGKDTSYQGVLYPSLTNAVNSIHELRPDIEKHVIEKRIRRNEPLPEKQRRHSKHPEAGTNLWRRWKGLLNKKNVCPEWLNGDAGYDCFKLDMGNPPTDKHKLYKKDVSEPHSKENSEWLTLQESIERTSGKEVWIDGVCYLTHSAAAKQYGLPLSTFMYRLGKGQSPEQAVSVQEKTTKKHGVWYDGLFFPSKTKLFEYAAQKYQITIGQAKDRWERSLPFIHSPKKGNPCVIKNIHFDSEKDAATYFGVSLSTFAKRRGKGFSIEEALGLT